MNYFIGIASVIFHPTTCYFLTVCLYMITVFKVCIMYIKKYSISKIEHIRQKLKPYIATKCCIFSESSSTAILQRMFSIVLKTSCNDSCDKKKIYFKNLLYELR